MATRRSIWKTTVPTLTLTAMPFTIYCSTASAFFPPVNNQLGQLSPPVTASVPPTLTPPVVVPPVSPPPFSPPPQPPQIVSPPPVTPPVVVEPQMNCHGTPEPSTLVAGLAGLTVAFAWSTRRRTTTTECGNTTM